MKVCTKCVLPETYPAIKFDSNGVCNFCSDYIRRKKPDGNTFFSSEEELIDCLKKFKKPGNDYDVLVPVSGGVDSCSALIGIVETFKLNPLVFHNDHGCEETTATDNVKKLCKELNVDLILWQHDADFMRKLWKFTIESNVKNLNGCYVCGNILYLNAVEIAYRFDIPLIINGYTKGMIPILTDKKNAREKFNEMITEMLAQGDKDFMDKFMRKNELLKKQKIFLEKQDLEDNYNREKILVIPFYIFKFYSTDKGQLQELCKERFDWQPIESSYPERTTNCQINWLNAWVDLKKMNYTFYHDEYSSLIRAGELTREQALKDLEFNPPPGLITHLVNELGINLNREKKLKNLAQPLKTELEFDF